VKSGALGQVPTMHHGCLVETLSPHPFPIPNSNTGFEFKEDDGSLFLKRGGGRYVRWLGPWMRR